jgi:ubiquinone/menaquinone biosynthesis C-methylase UbiE
MQRALRPRSGDVILDLGCGTGTEARVLAERVGPQGSVIGVDRSEAMVNEARTRARLKIPIAGFGLDFRRANAWPATIAFLNRTPSSLATIQGARRASGQTT